MSLSDRINQLLIEQNVKKVTLAKATGSPRATVTDWTSGKTKVLTYDKLVLVAHFFGVNQEWLNTGKGDKYPNKQTIIPVAVSPSVIAKERGRDYLDDLFDECDKLINEGIYPGDTVATRELYYKAAYLASDYNSPPPAVIAGLLRHMAKNKA